MHPADILASLKKKSSSVTAVADQLSVHPATVSKVISGRATSRRVAAAVAQIVGKPLSQLWPGRYDSRSALRKAA